MMKSFCSFELHPGGAVAQLGARLDGIEEVEGSNPFGSTIFTKLEIPYAARSLSAAEPIIGARRGFSFAGCFPGMARTDDVLTYCK
jgi:hypothetical protein